MVIQLWNDWLARRVLSRRTMSLYSTLRTVNNGHVQNWHRWKFEGTVVWASWSSKAIGQSISHVLMVILILLINVFEVGQVRLQEHFLNRDTHTHRCTSFGSFWAYSDTTVVQRGIVGPGIVCREATSIGRNCPFTKNELPEKWDLLFGGFQAQWILRWVLYFSFWKKWINKIWTGPTIILILAGSRQSI